MLKLKSCLHTRRLTKSYQLFQHKYDIKQSRFQHEHSRTRFQWKTEQRRQEAHNKQKKHSPLSNLLFYAIPATVTFCLGVWQTRRYFWKKEQIQTRSNTLYAQPEEFSEELVKSQEELEKNNYKCVKLEGYFDHSKQVFVGLRKSPVARRLNLHGNIAEQGYFIITPFITKQGKTVLVNRGWIPKSIYDEHEKVPDIEYTSIVGVIRPAETLNDPLAGKTRAQNNWFVAISPAEIMEFIGVKQQVTMLVDQVADEQVTSQPPTIQHPMMIERSDHLHFYVLPQTHIAYMVTWYGLCAWIIGTALYMNKKRTVFSR